MGIFQKLFWRQQVTIVPGPWGTTFCLDGKGRTKPFEADPDCSHIRGSMDWLIVCVNGDVDDAMDPHLIVFLFPGHHWNAINVRMQPWASKTQLLLSSLSHVCPYPSFTWVWNMKHSDFLPTALCRWELVSMNTSHWTPRSVPGFMVYFTVFSWSRRKLVVWQGVPGRVRTRIGSLFRFPSDKFPNITESVE